ncbi:MAG: LLM class F420-dependent oxidoreductase [Chloroflexi bacterium]|nr:LLM class F420-dependent oxidoreductase [Chloroflexota bacterium]
MVERWGFTFPLEGVLLPAHREVLLEAERLGYTDAWTFEINGADAFVPLALAAAWTERLRLGTAIANIYTRTPTLLAMEAAALAEAAPGRFCLGIGTSSPAIVEKWNGVPLRRPLRRMRETVAFLRQAFAGEKISTSGGSFEVDGFRLAKTPGQPPPVFVAALREKMLALAGSLADGVLINWLSPQDVAKVVAVAREAARQAGRDPQALEVACRIFVLPPVPDDVARMMGRWAIAAYLNTPVYSAFHAWLGRGETLGPMWEAWQAGDRRAALEAVPDRVVEDLFVMGDKRERLHKIEEYCRHGVTLPILNFAPGSQDPREQGAQTTAMLRELARP